jgi:hypothetical protein
LLPHHKNRVHIFLLAYELNVAQYGGSGDLSTRRLFGS